MVLDASAAIALLRDEPASLDVKRELRRGLDAGEPILAPPLFWLEVTNVLTHRYRYEPGAVVEAVSELEELHIVTADAGRPMTLAVIDAMARMGLTAYDAAYLVLADASDAALLTADAQLAAAAGERAILAGPRSVKERPARYGESAWLRWPGATSYMAKLRASLAQDAT